MTIGAVACRRVAFIARHGRHQGFAPHRVPYRANVWALREAGVRSIISSCSVGSLQPDIHPGQLVVVDQFVDQTRGRADTYYDLGGPAGAPGSTDVVHHQTLADPYDAVLRTVLVNAGRRRGADVIDGGTMVVINGPRFSTRAESMWFRAMGWHVVNMTGYPEAVLAAEVAVPYATIALGDGLRRRCRRTTARDDGRGRRHHAIERRTGQRCHHVGDRGVLRRPGDSALRSPPSAIVGRPSRTTV